MSTVGRTPRTSGIGPALVPRIPAASPGEGVDHDTEQRRNGSDRRPDHDRHEEAAPQDGCGQFVDKVI